MFRLGEALAFRLAVLELERCGIRVSYILSLAQHRFGATQTTKAFKSRTSCFIYVRNRFVDQFPCNPKP